MQVSDHPGLLDTSELLRPEAILKEKVIFTNVSKFDRDNQKHLKISEGLKHLSGSVPGLHKERCPWRKS